MNRFYLQSVIAVLSALLAGCEQPQNNSEDVYDTTVAEYRTIDITVEAAGIVEPETTVEVKSKASGEILSINAETGDYVEEETLLVQIDKRTPRNTVNQTEADLEAAKARRRIAETQLKRTKNLLDKGIVTETEYEQASLERANAEALVISRQVDLENARIALGDTDVNAPISGTIIEKNVERGQVISSPTQDVGGGTILLKMADLNTVRIRALVDETDIGKIRAGMPVTVNVSAFPGQSFSGEVLKIEPQATIEQNVTMFPVLIRLENNAGMLRPGMNAEIRISIARAENVLAVPTMALRTDRDIPATASLLGLSAQELRQQIGGANAATTASVVAGDSERAVLQRQAANRGGRVKDSLREQQASEHYWVLVMVNGKPVPRTVTTGVTNLDYSEIVNGLSGNDEVLMLPSSGLIERQERMQGYLNRRMRVPGMGDSS